MPLHPPHLLSVENLPLPCKSQGQVESSLTSWCPNSPASHAFLMQSQEERPFPTQADSTSASDSCLHRNATHYLLSPEPFHRVIPLLTLMSWSKTKWTKKIYLRLGQDLLAPPSALISLNNQVSLNILFEILQTFQKSRVFFSYVLGLLFLLKKMTKIAETPFEPLPAIRQPLARQWLYACTVYLSIKM